MAQFDGTTIPALPGYHLLDCLHQGSRTAVYRARHTATERPVVVKVLAEEYPSFTKLVQFRNQYTVTKNLPLSGIVRSLDLVPWGNSYALVMEDVGGLSLAHYLQRHSLTLEDVLDIAVQLSDIFHDLHQQRVIHKDIKPANILIHPDSKQVKLIDFSIASLLPKETQALQSPQGLEGTLGYLAPEQTGRMNRGIDYRTDFYGLGVSLYQLLTGQLPFTSQDPLELIHAHMAQMPVAVDQLNPDVPAMVGAIVAKLMAKNAEDRYQSAWGLKHDLERCLFQWKEQGEITEFELGQRDISDRFLIPEKLYGREQEVQTLLDAFERVANGTTELMLVAGFSGIGKTAVVNEVHKPITRQQGYFIKGKFDQFNRDIPLSAFVQAFRDLMSQLLSETEEQLAQWRTQILTAVGENGQVLIDVIPELEQIIGQQPLAPELSGSAAQNRFNLLFQKFIAVLTAPEHPLVMFLDDLQWADSASLNLLKLLLINAEQQYLFIIGAYRDNEVFPAHPLMLTLENIKKHQVQMHTLTLNPLATEHIHQLVTDTLQCSAELTAPLEELVYQKTQGNPFFATQFLQGLYEDGCITFNATGGYWLCDLAQVKQLALTDDVVEFMVQRLRKLLPETQNALKLAACIGNQFDLVTLAVVCKTRQEKVAADLWQALQEGLIIPESDTYKFFQGQEQNHEGCEFTISYRFLHDRVQQAAYLLIPDSQKQETHWHIGQLLLNRRSETEVEENIFDIVNQLNHGLGLLQSESERYQLAELNLTAGHKAKRATAYASAMNYATLGLNMLPQQSWQERYQLTLDFYTLAVETAYLNGEFVQMEELAAVASSQARSWLDLSNIYEAKIQACMAQNQPLKALDLVWEALEHLDVNLPKQPSEADIGQALQHTQELLSGKSVESLLTLSEMSAADKKAAMVMLSIAVTAAYQSAPNLLPLLIFAQVDLSLKYGNDPKSTYGYIMYGLMQVVMLGDIETGCQFGRLGMNLLQRFPHSKIAAKTVFGFNVHLKYLKEPAKDTLNGLLQAYTWGLETGDLELAALSLMCHDYTAYFTGQPLDALKQVMQEHRKVIQQLRQDIYTHIHGSYYQSVLNLLEVTADPDRLCSQVYDEDEMIPLHLEANQLVAVFQIYFNKLILSYLFQRYEQALENASRAEQYLNTATGLLHTLLFSFYDALIRLASYPTASETEQTSILERVTVHQENLDRWAVHAPSNQTHRCALVAAERCRVLGQKSDAIDLYDHAIADAKANDYIQEEALANELAAKFYLDWGKERLAREYMVEAYYGYARWGAKAKLADLEARYPQLLAPILQQTHTPLSVDETVFSGGTATSPSTSSTSISSSLDLSTVLNASQVISSEIELDQLVATLLTTVVQMSGASRCILMLQDEPDLTVQAQAELTELGPIETQVFHPPVPLSDSRSVPISFVNTVRQSLEPAVITNATQHPNLAKDAYVQTQQPKSLLCCPILHQGKLLGMVYLENNVVSGAFTRDRVKLLNLLCAQAAIALENARLYQQSQQALVQLRDKETRLQNLAANIPGMVYQLRLGSDGSPSTPYVSSGCLDLYELDPADVMAGKCSITAMHHPEDDAAIAQAMMESAQNLSPFTASWRIITPSGKVKWLQAAARPERKTDGSLVWDGVVLDVSDRKRAETVLNQRTAELEETLQELQRTQMQMVQAEKMSGLGQLVAGVAHEINNPVNFISGNLNHADNYIQDLFDLLQLYQHHHCPPHPEVQDRAEDIDLEFLFDDLPKLLKSMKIGASRIQKIVASLRTFSRMDEAEMKEVNIHDGIDSTLMILQHRLKAKTDATGIKVIKTYGDLPLIECYAGQLNQVFMNLLSNAIDALQEAFDKGKVTTPTIIIKTELVGSNQVAICITDNGPGIPNGVREKIFDPFFTTKPIGKGTGMGLSISYQIVTDKHQGTLSCTSAQSQTGTTFTVMIPIRQS
jgi:predicted ATPase/signal transduction histidine kinase/GAF domain-containing protein